MKHHCQLRRLYIQIYSAFLQQTSNVDIYAMQKIERILDSKVILLWRTGSCLSNKNVLSSLCSLICKAAARISGTEIVYGSFEHLINLTTERPFQSVRWDVSLKFHDSSSPEAQLSQNREPDQNRIEPSGSRSVLMYLGSVLDSKFSEPTTRSVLDKYLSQLCWTEQISAHPTCCKRNELSSTTNFFFAAQQDQKSCFVNQKKLQRLFWLVGAHTQQRAVESRVNGKHARAESSASGGTRSWQIRDGLALDEWALTRDGASL
ncbi:hypothetical protein KSP40_PGU009903 [Platanthera guangdongensis]|uniref:Uncharacterized protein n=1 Tax=Platanthera guangdongensis TaxID=2320717 RepID=A0ABR2LK57_9ASPA